MNFPYLVWEICDKHNTARRAGEQCAACAMEADRQQRDVLNVLEARISDMEQAGIAWSRCYLRDVQDRDSEIRQLRVRVTQLEHLLRNGGALQEAHNRLVSYAESIDERLKEAEALLLSTLTRP